jgi:hypothetical protein
VKTPSAMLSKMICVWFSRGCIMFKKVFNVNAPVTGPGRVWVSNHHGGNCDAPILK